MADGNVMVDILDRLDAAAYSTTPSVILIRDAAAEIRRLRRALKEAEREARDAAIGAASEARWQERQGDEYGSF